MQRLSLWLSTCALLLSGGSGWAQQTIQVSLTAQERLDAIRLSLVETALQGATQVRSTQWLDAQGQLRDASSFRSGMEVRGVQVQSYSRDSGGTPKAQLSSSGASKDLARNPTEAASQVMGQCKPASLRHVMSLSTEFEPGTSSAIQKQVRQQIAAHWLASQDNAWRMIELSVANPVLSTGATPSSYERALTRTGTQQLPWTATVRVRARTEELPTWEKIAGRTPHHTVMTLDLVVQGASGQNKKFQATQSLRLPLATSDWGGAHLDDQGAAQLQAIWAAWGDRLDQWMGCDPLHPVVTKRSANQVQINAGGLAGVRPGDEWLLADPQSFPSQVVGTASSTLLLAKVVEVSPHHARLAVLAGPADAIKTDWRAWPAESMNR